MKMLDPNASNEMLIAALNVSANLVGNAGFKMDQDGTKVRIVNFAIELLEEIESRRVKHSYERNYGTTKKPKA